MLSSSLFSLPDPKPGSHTSIAVAFGDGIGPEIMQAIVPILEEAGASLNYFPVELGEAVYKSGFTSGIKPESWDVIRNSKALLKAPITTPQGGGFKSLNVTIRKSLGLFANVRPCVAYAPFVKTQNPSMNIVIIRENEEDLYAGIEHRQTNEVYQCLKLVSRPGCERIIRYAFEYARANRRKKVTCMTKDNIMKLTDGLFHKVFDEIGEQYPEIEKDHYIIDIGMARVATRPEIFDVIVTSNLYGDILSDIAAELTGSVGLAPSANVGDSCSMFEAIHGSAPDIAGKDIANPSGLLLASVMMLVNLGQPEVASRIHNAWLSTIEQGIHTADIYDGSSSKQKVGTAAFGNAVRERLGQVPNELPSVSYADSPQINVPSRNAEVREEKKELVGVDIFVQFRGNVDDLAAQLRQAEGDVLQLQMITNRGVKVWPAGFPETFHTDHWRCRFMMESQSPVAAHEVASLIGRVVENKLDFIKAETLCTFDGAPGYSLGQGQ
ncbi:NADP-dependent isocitrate dehydrogenase [Kamptonema cortianum]|nr:NADP-dependent isocitrate dehydrogenase [Geitlerinema splendidum]MDK3157096.1 NADP-dependent isocitrate dehydrogenase [Kamptonema cortianum]